MKKFDRLEVTWKTDTNPQSAREIAAHVMRLIEQMDMAGSRASLGDLYDGFRAYARQRRVCAPICQHVSDKFFKMYGDMQVSPTAVRNPAGADA